MLTILASTGSPAFDCAAPPLGRVTRGREVALEVHADHRVPLLLARREDHAVAQEAGVVDEHVEAAERVDRGVHQAAGALPVGDVVGVGDGLAARRDDLVDEELRGRAVGTGSLARDAEVVHDDARAFTREQACVLAADAAPGAGHDHDPPFADARQRDSLRVARCGAGAPRPTGRSQYRRAAPTA